MSHRQTFRKLGDYTGPGTLMPFALQPTLTGTLLQLRPLRPDDENDLYSVASDPNIWKQHPVSDRYTERVFRDFFKGALESGGAFAVVDRATGHIIGSSRYHGYDEQRSEIEIGWTFLATAFWGGVYNREMKTLMLRHAFQFVDTVIFLVGPQNWRSQRAMEKLGALRCSELRRNADGRESIVFTIAASRFLADTHSAGVSGAS